VRVDLTQAVDYALEANPDVLRAREQVEEFRLLVREVRSEALPKLDLRLSYQRIRDPGLRNNPSFGDIEDGGFLPPEALGAQLFDDYAYRLDLEQPIYTFGRVSAALRGAREQLAAVKTDVRSVEIRVARDVAVGYYDLLLARGSLAVLESERTTRERQVERVRDRLELGDATRLDLLNAEVALANLRPEILAAENAVDVTRARLNETLGRSVTEPIETTDTLGLPEPLPAIPGLSELMALASTTRPELLRFDLTRRVLREGQKVTRADTLPEISANAGIGINSFAFENLNDPEFRNWNVGVSLRWTLFDGFRTSSAIGQLRSQERQSELQERSFRASLSRELERASGEWHRGLEAVRVAKLAVEQAREAQQVADDSLTWGAATVLETLEAQRGMRQAELTRVRAFHVCVTALADTKFLVGLRPDETLVAASVPGSGAAVSPSMKEP